MVAKRFAVGEFKKADSSQGRKRHRMVLHLLPEEEDTASLRNQGRQKGCFEGWKLNRFKQNTMDIYFGQG